MWRYPSARMHRSGSCGLGEGASSPTARKALVGVHANRRGQGRRPGARKKPGGDPVRLVGTAEVQSPRSFAWKKFNGTRNDDRVCGVAK